MFVCCLYVYVSRYVVGVYVWMDACIHDFMYVWLSVYLQTCMYVCVYVCMYVCMYVYMIASVSGHVVLAVSTYIGYGNISCTGMHIQNTTVPSTKRRSLY